MSDTDKFEKKIKHELDESTDELNPDVLRRLQQARYAALEQSVSKPRWSFFPQAVTAVFAIAVISMSFFFNFNNTEIIDSELVLETELEMFTSVDSLELMEDLEFIQWLAESEEYAS